MSIPNGDDINEIKIVSSDYMLGLGVMWLGLRGLGFTTLIPLYIVFLHNIRRRNIRRMLLNLLKYNMPCVVDV